MSVISVTEDNFDELVLHASQKVLLDFWAPWCGPCRMLAPIIEQIAQEREDILVGKVNVEEAKTLATRFQVVSIPTIVVMESGEEIARSVGYAPKEEILEVIPE